jgi:methylated-DNA-protein-cysteine methyltransferase related protein
MYALVKTIPRGHAATYGQLARLARLRGGAREAGHAMAACPAGKGIPWHRVLGKGGRLLIREPFASLQRKLLESEGVPFDQRGVSLAACGWNPHKNSRLHKREGKSTH